MRELSRKLWRFVALCTFLCFFPLKLQAKTPILVVMGGFWSCGQDAGLKPDPSFSNAAGSIIDIFKAAREAMAQSYGSESFGQFMTCYPIDPQDAYYKTNLGPLRNTQKASVDKLIADLNALAQTVPDPELYIVGHSYGGWTAMQSVLRLDRHLRIRALITLDPISKRHCTPDIFLQGIVAKAALDFCAEAPRDFTKAQITTMMDRVETWINYYQTGAIYLHSSAIEHDNRIVNHLIDYPFQPEAIGDHIQFLIDPLVINAIARTFSQLLNVTPR